jgi:hypothetical protein
VGSMVARLRFCEPAPHDMVQEDHAVHAGTMQSVAQACLLHGFVSAECAVALPPNLG